MITTIQECEGSFSINLTAESMMEAALLTRMGMNAVGKISFETDARRDGIFSSRIWAKKSKRASSTIVKRR